MNNDIKTGPIVWVRNTLRFSNGWYGKVNDVRLFYVGWSDFSSGWIIKNHLPGYKNEIGKVNDNKEYQMKYALVTYRNWCNKMGLGPLRIKAAKK